MLYSLNQRKTSTEKNDDNKIDVFAIRRGSFIVIFNQKGANSIHHNAYTLSQQRKKKNERKKERMPIKILSCRKE